MASINKCMEMGSGRSFQLYHHVPETAKGPCVIFVPGYMSHGKGLKADYLLKHCQKKGLEFISYDPEGLGANDPEGLASVEFKHWVEDCKRAVEETENKKILLVGSSMGSMISLKVALSDPGRIWKLLLIAPAVNVMYSLFETWYENFDENERQKVDRGEVHYLKNEYGVKQPIRRAFFDNLREEDIDLSKEIPVDCPIKILHGVRDDTVPHQISLDLLSKITSKDIDLIFRKNGEHRMSTEEDLKFLTLLLDDMWSE